jgi:hypothetical protein
MANIFFLSNNTRGDKISPPEFSFHRCWTSRWVQGHGAKYNEGREGLQHHHHQQQHLTDSRVRLDASRKTPTDRWFVPPLNNILAGFAVTIMPCTTPRSYAALLPPSIWGPTSGMGTKSGDGHASPRSPDTTTSLEVDGETHRTYGLTYHHSTPSTGRKPWRGMAAAVEIPPGIRFSGTIKESADGAETPEEDTRRIVNQRPKAKDQSHPRRAKHQQEGESKRREHWAAAGAGIYPSTVVPSRGSQRCWCRHHRL